MKRFQSWLPVGLVLMLAVTVQASFVYKDKAQMIETADAIAVVEITGVQKQILDKSTKGVS